MLGEEVQTKGKLMNSVPGGEIQLMDQNDTLHRKDDFDLVELFLGPTNHLFKKVSLSVCPLVNWLVGPLRHLILGGIIVHRSTAWPVLVHVNEGSGNRLHT